MDMKEHQTMQHKLKRIEKLNISNFEKIGIVLNKFINYVDWYTLYIADDNMEQLYQYINRKNLEIQLIHESSRIEPIPKFEIKNDSIKIRNLEEYELRLSGFNDEIHILLTNYK
jgi:hypothetical protein